MVLVAGCSTPAPVVPTPPSTTEATPTPPPTPGPGGVALDLVRDGLASPVLVLGVPGLDALAFVEQGGRVAFDDRVVLDLDDRVQSGGERGLLGFAFHPTFPTSGVAFASYTGNDGNAVLSRLRYVGDAFDAASEEVLLVVPDPFANHNGGHVTFGPDGYLYLGLGDGGSGGDPQGNGQDPDALLGSILRLDVGTEGPYRVPSTNPFVGRAGADEVWAKGLRNPWRFAFDPGTGDLYIGDVGQGSVEEIDHQRADSPGGENYGWNVWEGDRRYDPLGVTFSTPVAPVATYATHEGGTCAVTGGVVPRGEAAPSLRGAYLFADYCSGDVWTMRFEDGTWRTSLLLETTHRVSSFGQDEAGDAYLVDHAGAVYRFVDPSLR